LEENLVVNRNDKTYFNLGVAYIRKVTVVSVVTITWPKTKNTAYQWKYVTCSASCIQTINTLIKTYLMIKKVH